MPLTIDCAEDGGAIELAELVESLDRDFDPRDEAALVQWAPALRRLACNRRFLGDLVIEELKQHCFGQSRSNQYSAQVILLHGASKNYLIRANFWPADTDSVFTNSGAKPFFYGLPHDHNFSFLTAGYLGPGYWSDYYEYDYEDVLGYPGETVDLRFVERSQLSAGKVMLYRKHLDVHSQLPPESLSVSLNILAMSPALEFQEQYSFDLDSSTVTGFVNRSGLETLIRLAGTFGGGNGADLIDHVARRHPSDRMRFAGWRAKAAQAPDVDSRIAVYEEAARSSDGQLSALARSEAARVRECRPWLIGGGTAC
ncbi:MAG TPA: transposase [Allosphingosinicella sp.]|nr:transposase [Allosphingosinicella sp.]